MAETAAEAKNPLTQENIWEAGYKALNPTVEVFLKNKSEYADLYTYVQIFRKAASEIGGNPGVDAVHAYMLKEANAKRLGLPSKLRNKKSLNKLFGQARTYTATQGAFPQPADVRNAYAEYEKKNIVDKKDADKKVGDTEKAINNKKKIDRKVATRKSRRNWWGWALSHVARAALVVGAIVTVSSLGLGAGIFATLGAAAQIGVGATTIGASAFGVWGFGRVKDRCWTRRGVARDEIEKIDTEISDLKKELIKAKTAQGKIDTRLEEDASATLEDYPEDIAEEMRAAENEVANEREEVEQNAREMESHETSVPAPESERPPVSPERGAGGSPESGAGRPPETVNPVPSISKELLGNLKEQSLKETLSTGDEDLHGQERAVCQDVQKMMEKLSEDILTGVQPVYLTENAMLEKNDSDKEFDKQYESLYYTPTGIGTSKTLDNMSAAKILYVSSLDEKEMKKYGITPKQKSFVDKLAYKLHTDIKKEKVVPPKLKRSIELYNASGKAEAAKLEDNQKTIDTIKKCLKDKELSQVIVHAEDDAILGARKHMLIQSLVNPSISSQLTPEEKAKCLRLVYDLNREREKSAVKTDSVIDGGLAELSKAGGLFEEERKTRVAFAAKKINEKSLKPEELTEEDLSLLISIMQDETIVGDGKEFELDGKKVTIDKSKLIKIAFDASKVHEGKEIKDKYLGKQLNEFQASDDYKDEQESKDVNKKVQALIAYSDYIKADGAIDDKKVEELLDYSDKLFEKDETTEKRKSDHLSSETKIKLKQKIAEVLMIIDTGKKITEEKVNGVKISSVELSDKYKDAVKNITAYDTKSKSKTEKSLGVIINGVAGDDKAEYYKKLNAENAIFARNEENVKEKNEKGVEVEVNRPRLSTRLRKKILSTSLKDDKEISKILGDMKEGLEHPEKLSPRDKLIYRAFIYKLKEDKASIPRPYRGAVGKFYKGANVLESDQFERIAGTKAGARGLGYTDEKSETKLLDLTAEEKEYVDACERREAKETILKRASDVKKEIEYVSAGNNFYYATIQHLLKKKEEYAYDAKMQEDIDEKIDYIVKGIEGRGLDININKAWNLDTKNTGKIGYLSEEDMKALNIGVLYEKRMEIIQSCFKKDDKGVLTIDPSKIELARQLMQRVEATEKDLPDKGKTDLSKFIVAIEKFDKEAKKVENENSIEGLIDEAKLTDVGTLLEKDVKDKYEKMLKALDLELVGDDKKKKLFDHIVKYKMQADKAKKASAIDTMRDTYKDKFESVDAEIVKQTINEISATVTASGKPVTELSDEQFKKLEELQKYLEEKDKLGAKVEIDPALTAQIDGLKTAYKNKKAEEAKINGYNNKILGIKGSSDLVKAEGGKLVLNEGLDPEKINVVEYLEGYMEAINGESDIEFVNYAISHLKEVLGSDLFKHSGIQTKLQEYKNEMTRVLSPTGDQVTIGHLRELGLYPTEEELRAEEARIRDKNIDNALNMVFDEAWDDDAVEKILNGYDGLLSDAGLTEEQREKLRNKKQSIEQTQKERKLRTERFNDALNIPYDDATFEETLSSLDALSRGPWLSEEQKAKLDERIRELKEDYEKKKQSQDEDDEESILGSEFTEEELKEKIMQNEISMEELIKMFADAHKAFYVDRSVGTKKLKNGQEVRDDSQKKKLNNVVKGIITASEMGVSGVEISELPESYKEGLLNSKELNGIDDSVLMEVAGDEGAIHTLMGIMAKGTFEDKTLTEKQRRKLAHDLAMIIEKKLNKQPTSSNENQQVTNENGNESGD